nr:universal stress protein [Kibdelosporangium sp. MJ126-NF4]CEL13617.1 Universal stress protein family [Kibdelosporangium sp. MJ126-NF4]CTQ99303.1 Universal stress protein family [Kibdelosporangium sp. MJ126-NF4]
MQSTVDRSVLVAGYDGSAAAERAVMWAAREAVGHGLGLAVVQAVGLPVMPDSTTAGWISPQVLDADEQQVLLAHAQTELDRVADACRTEHPDLTVESRVVSGRGSETLAEVASSAWALVIGPAGRSALPRVLLGSTAAELLQSYTRPIVIVRHTEGQPEGKHVVVGVDGSQTSTAAVDFAFDFADRHGHDLVAVHAWSDLPLDALAPVREWDYAWQDVHEKAEQLFHEALAGHRERHPTVTVRQQLSADRPAHALLEHAEGAALLVVGSHGRGALRRALLGSVSHAVAYHAPCPVAIVRPDND